MDKNLFFNLLNKYRDGTASDAEIALIEEYYRRLESAGTTQLTGEEEAALKELLYKKITSHIGLHEPQEQGTTVQETKVIALQRKNYRLVAAAAAVLVMAGATGYYWLVNKPQTTSTQPVTAKTIHKDLPPGKDAAVLTLADGKKIILDSTSGTITQQGNVTVLNVKGQLSYAPTAKVPNNAEVIYNTVTTARGNQYQLVLADGSKVWLNSASSLRFPTSFTGQVREVELDGEGYFEVAKNTAKPFHVKTRKQDITVLGTHFNVNGYKDEEVIKTTLLEGKVRVQSAFHDKSGQADNRQSAVLIPGQQAIASNNSTSIHVTENIDIDQVMAWKNGWFEFDNTDLRMIMRQVSRWYDVDIAYETKTGNEKYGGRISRNLNLSNILKMLESYGLHFRLEGKRLIVL
jgi:transmembrane sensor